MFCIIIPTFSESANLGNLIARLETACAGKDFRVVVVDDNSPDGTALIASNANEDYGNIQVHVRTSERGLGSALLKGIQLAFEFPECDRVVTIDGDLSHDPDEIWRLLEAANQADLVQGSRYLRESTIIGWPARRLLLSRTANALCRLLLNTGLHDNTSSYRVYSRRLAEMLMSLPTPRGFEFVLVPILVARQAGLPIVEVGITFRDRQYGKSKIGLKTLISWALFVVRTAWRHRILGRALFSGDR